MATASVRENEMNTGKHLTAFAQMESISAVRSSMFLSTETAWRLVDILVAKGILTKGEARATLYAIADGIRNDADGTSSTESTEMLARFIEEAGDRY